MSDSAAQTQGTGVGPEPHTLGTRGLTVGAEHFKSAAKGTAEEREGRTAGRPSRMAKPRIASADSVFAGAAVIALVAAGLWLLLYWVTT